MVLLARFARLKDAKKAGALSADAVFLKLLWRASAKWSGVSSD
jgi:hypothetical protein